MLIFVINLASSKKRRDLMRQKIEDLAKQSPYPIFLESKLLNSESSEFCVNSQSEILTTPESKIRDSLSESTIYDLSQMPTSDAMKANLDANLNEAFYFHFFDAICAESQECKKEPLKHYSPFLTKLVRGRELSANEVYCFASHFSLWQQCIDLGRDIIVLEDDVSFCDNFLDAIIAIKNSRFEYVRLYYLFEKKCHHLNGNFYVSYANLSGAQGYFLSCRGARKFIKHAKTWFHCVDNYMDMFFINDVANIVYKPFCIREDDEVSHDSTIQTREKTKIGGGRKILREIARIALFSIYKNIYLMMKRYDW